MFPSLTEYSDRISSIFVAFDAPFLTSTRESSCHPLNKERCFPDFRSKIGSVALELVAVGSRRRNSMLRNRLISSMRSVEQHGDDIESISEWQKHSAVLK